jgi:hypothetical protein
MIHRVPGAVASALLALAAAPRPPLPRVPIAPPGWIQGEWQNTLSPEPQHLETILFLEDDIHFSSGSADKPLSAEARFASCPVRESSDGQMYRLEIGPDCGSYVYEFRVVRGACGTGRSAEALVYTITRGDSVIQPPVASCSLLLFKRDDG